MFVILITDFKGSIRIRYFIISITSKCSEYELKAMLLFSYKFIYNQYINHNKNKTWPSKYHDSDCCFIYVECSRGMCQFVYNNLYF